MGGSGGNDTEVWGFLNAFDFCFPSEEQLKQIKAIIIPGSNLSVSEYKTLSWMSVLKDFIKSVYQNHKHIKFLGICFGA